MIDFHCHILPDIDDGSQSMESSLAMARQAVEDGVTCIVATPHGSFNGLGELLEKRDSRLAELRAALMENNIQLELLPGLEYFADGHSSNAGLNHPACRCGVPEFEERPLLVELPFTIDIAFAANVLFNAQRSGIPLVLAHPERYDGFLKHVDQLMELQDKGLYLQFNSNNFKGSFFSRAIPKAILRLIEHDREQVLVGSDAHHPEFRPAVLTDARERIVSAFGEDCWTLISDVTPRRLLGLAR